MSARPALFSHCVEVYKAMEERASVVGADEDDEEVVMYEGFLTKLFRELLLPVPYYTHVMDQLRSMNCVLQVRRGGGNSPSQWRLYREPTIELWDAWRVGQHTNRKASSNDQRDQRINDLHRRVSFLESAVEELLEGRTA